MFAGIMYFIRYLEWMSGSQSNKYSSLWSTWSNSYYA